MFRHERSLRGYVLIHNFAFPICSKTNHSARSRGPTFATIRFGTPVGESFMAWCRPFPPMFQHLTGSSKRRTLAPMNSRRFPNVFSAPRQPMLRLALLLSASTFFSAAHAQNLVVNGSFEFPDIVNGWQVDGGFIGNSNPSERESGFYIGVSVSQTLTTVPGQRYLL